jgi:cyclase
VRGTVSMLTGAGGNIVVDSGDDGVLVVDTGAAAMTDQVIAAIQKTAVGKTIRDIVNTSLDAGHTGGNEKLAALGKTIAGGDVANLTADSQEGAAVLAHQNVLERRSRAEGDHPAAAFKSLPTDTYFGARKDLFFNDEAVILLHPVRAHTDGDSMVFFRRSDVISSGDVFVTTSYPVIDLASGGSYLGIVDALERLVDIIIPVYGQDGGTLVIPGHGRLSNLGDVLNFREMVLVVRDRLQSMIKSGMTLEQVKAAKPTFDYDPVYGATSGFWTTDKFVEAAYKSLSEPAQEPKK